MPPTKISKKPAEAPPAKTAPTGIVKAKASVHDLIASVNKMFKAEVATTSDKIFIDKIPLDIPSFDYVSAGGMPVNRVVELYGPEGSCKTWLALKAIAEFQKFDWHSRQPNAIKKVNYVAQTRKDGTVIYKDDTLELDTTNINIDPANVDHKHCVFIDVEGTFDHKWAEKLGVDTKGLIYVRPAELSGGIDNLEAFMCDPKVSLVVFDSLGSASPNQEAAKQMDGAEMGVSARFWNKAMRKILSAMNRNTERVITLIIINGEYSNITAYGGPKETKGGNQIKYTKGLAIRLNAKGAALEAKFTSGTKAKIARTIGISCGKSKVGVPFRDSYFTFTAVDNPLGMAGTIDKITDLFNVAVKLDLLDKAGAYYAFESKAEGLLRYNGGPNFCLRLRKSPAVLQELKDLVYSKLSTSSLLDATVDLTSDDDEQAPDVAESTEAEA